MNPTLTVLDFFKILYNIARNFPKTVENDGQKDIELTCKRTNTFAVIYSKEQVNTDNIEKDIRYKNNQLFYSRHWEETELHPSKIKFYYPAFCVAEADTVFENALEDGYSETVTFNLMILDKMPPKLTEDQIDSPCYRRSFEEVGEDLKSIMRQIILELAGYGFFEFTDSGNNDFSGWFSSAWIEAQYDLGNIKTFNCLSELSAFIRQTVQCSKIFRAFTDNLAGFFANIQIDVTSCEKKTWDYGTIEEYTNTTLPTVPDSSV